jgi:hypothetical protein
VHHRIGSALRVAAATLVCFAITSPALAQNAGNVTGLVTDSASQPVSGASVTAAGKSATTNASGQYTLQNVKSGTQTVTASKLLYKSGSVTVNVLRKKTITAPTIVLVDNSATVSGSVVDANTNAAIASATVAVSGTSLSTITNGTGSYSIKVPAGSQQSLVASASGYQSSSQAVNLAVGASATVNFRLTPNTTTPPGNTLPWNGTSSFWLGLNFPWWNYGTDFGTGGWGKFTDWANLETQMAIMRSQGVRMIRWWVFADGRYAPDFNADGTVSGLDSFVLADLDKAMALAAKYNLYLMLAVTDANIVGPGSSDGAVQMGGHGVLITNAAVRQTYLDRALKPLLQHVAASPYAKYVAAYDVMNEPELQVQGFWGSQFTRDQMKGFLADCVNYIHLYGGGAYATVGSAMPGWASAWAGIGQDVYQVHWYPGFDNGAPFMSSLPTAASLGLDKPVIVGEFATAVTQAQMQQQLDTIYARGYAGALAWSYWVGDSATNWSSSQPVFTAWSQQYYMFVGPR